MNGAGESIFPFPDLSFGFDDLHISVGLKRLAECLTNRKVETDDSSI